MENITKLATRIYGYSYYYRFRWYSAVYCHGDPTSVGTRWKKWKCAFDFFVVGKGITDVTQKKALLLHCGGMDMQDIYHTLLGFQKAEMNQVRSTLYKSREQKRATMKCFRCGQVGHHQKDLTCPARDKECFKCNKKGHFFKCCKQSIIKQ